MSYFEIYMEELLDGEIHGFNTKSLVRRIDDAKEFKLVTKTNPEARGVITYGGDLFLNAGNTHGILHTHLLEYLFKKRFIRIKITGDMFLDKDFELEDYLNHFLCVQVKGGKLYVGESYTDEFYAKINKDSNVLKRYVNWMQEIGVPFVPEDVLGLGGK